MKVKQNNIETLFAEKSWYHSESLAPPVDLLVRSLHEKLKSNFIQILKPYGIQFSEWLVLTLLHANKPFYSMTAADINAGMLFSAGGLSKVMTRLCKLGLIYRIDNPNDGRSKLAQLTQKGLKTVKLIHEQKRIHEQQDLKALNEEELAQLIVLLRKLNRD